MSEQRIAVVEKQMDAMAQHVEALRLQVQGLLDILGREKNAQLLGLQQWELTDLRKPAGAILARGEHKDEREQCIRKAEREAEIDSLLRDRRYRTNLADLVGPEKAEALIRGEAGTGDKRQSGRRRSS